MIQADAMKFLPSQLMFLLQDREARRNIAALTKFLVLLAATIALFSVAFHAIMVLENQQHSWLTGVYWTLTVMSTLGFGDITFHSDLGRAFSILVLLTGIVMLLIVLPFTFIRFFYAPWLEAQVRLRAPRQVEDSVSGHVVICRYDPIAQALVSRLRRDGIPYLIIEPDPAVAAHLHGDDVPVITGEPTAPGTYLAAGVGRARLVFANLGDPENTNITLAVREVAPEVPIVALAEDDNSIDILELAGVNRVLPLKQALGEHLASRVTVGSPKAHRVGRFEDLVVAEFPVENTALPGRTIRDTRLRELTGLSIVAVWDQGDLHPAGPETVLQRHSVPIIVGTEEQVTELDALFIIYRTNDNPILVLGGGKVGTAAARALQARGALVTIIDKDPAAEERLRACADNVVIGDAADLDIVTAAGVREAPAVVLTTNDDATNIFLAVYCRRLNPDVRIISRISEEWNLESIHRAGADFSLSHGSLAAQSVMSEVTGNELFVLAEGADLFVEPVPPKLEGLTLAESGIGARAGLQVIATRCGGETTTSLGAATVLEPGTELVMLGGVNQHRRFLEIFVRGQ